MSFDLSTLETWLFPIPHSDWSNARKNFNSGDDVIPFDVKTVASHVFTGLYFIPHFLITSSTSKTSSTVSE